MTEKYQEYSNQIHRVYSMYVDVAITLILRMDKQVGIRERRANKQSGFFSLKIEFFSSHYIYNHQIL